MEEKTKREHIVSAIISLKIARGHLVDAGTRRAAAAVRRALDSALSAQRNARKLS